MPKNKDQQRRMRQINGRLHLRKDRGVSKKELAQLCEVSESTIKNDIRLMREEHDAPLNFDPKIQRYRYTRPFDLPADLALGADDVFRLQLAAETLTQFSHLDIFAGLQDTVEKIRSGVTGWVRTNADAQAIFFEPLPYYHGTEHFPVLLQGIRAQHIVEFVYQSFTNPQPIQIELAPYCLRQHDQRWYVVGKSKQHDYIKPFAVERILKKPEVTSNYFAKPIDFDPDTFFRYTYGMHRYPDSEVQDVVLEFKSLQARYFRSKPFHQYEILDESPDVLKIRMRLVVNIELLRKIASLGPEVKVIEPLTLQSAIRELFRKALKLYE